MKNHISFYCRKKMFTSWIVMIVSHVRKFNVFRFLFVHMAKISYIYGVFYCCSFSDVKCIKSNQERIINWIKQWNGFFLLSNWKITLLNVRLISIHVMICLLFPFEFRDFLSQGKARIVHFCWYSLLINLSNSIIYMISFHFVFDKHRNKSIFLHIHFPNYKCLSIEAVVVVLL